VFQCFHLLVLHDHALDDLSMPFAKIVTFTLIFLTHFIDILVFLNRFAAERWHVASTDDADDNQRFLIERIPAPMLGNLERDNTMKRCVFVVCGIVDREICFESLVGDLNHSFLHFTFAYIVDPARTFFPTSL